MKRKLSIPVTRVIIVICSIITILIDFVPASLSVTERAIFFGAYYKAFICAGEWWRLLTVGFVHVSLMHFFVNMLSLYSLGRALEPMLKSGRFLILLFGSVIGGSVFLFCTSGNTVGVGISGGLYGMLAAYIYLVWNSGAMKIPHIRNGVMQTVMINLMINFMPGVAWKAHFGGAVTGLLLLMILVKQPDKEELRRNAIIALAVFSIIFGFAVTKRASIAENDRYLQTDINILRCESELGLSSYAEYMAKNLDRVYDISNLESTLY